MREPEWAAFHPILTVTDANNCWGAAISLEQVRLPRGGSIYAWVAETSRLRMGRHPVLSGKTEVTCRGPEYAIVNYILLPGMAVAAGTEDWLAGPGVAYGGFFVVGSARELVGELVGCRQRPRGELWSCVRLALCTFGLIVYTGRYPRSSGSPRLSPSACSLHGMPFQRTFPPGLMTISPHFRSR